MALNLYAGMLGMNYAYSGAGDWMSLNEQRYQLADYTTQRMLSGNPMSMVETASVAQVDKALALQGEQAKIQYEVGLAMQDGAEQARQQDRNMRQRLQSAGAVFV